MPVRPGLDLPDVLSKVDAAVLAHDPGTGEILAANQSAEELYERPVDELVGLPVGALTSDDAAYSEGQACERIEAAARGEPQQFEWLNRHDDGRRYWVRVNLERATVADRTVVLATVRDVSAYKANEERMKLIYRVLRHNLRNEMNVVSGNAEALRDAVRGADVDADALERIDAIHETAAGVSALSERVGELERAALDGAPDRRERELSAVVGEAVDRVRERYDDPEIDVSNVADCVVNVDEVFVCGLEQLVDNAVEHGTPEADSPATADPTTEPRTVGETDGGRTKAVEVSARLGDGEGAVNVLVADAGPGIPGVETEVLDTDVDQDALRHGSGLGLWVAKWAVEAHDGVLLFAENERGGTTVHVRAPIGVDA